MAASANTSLSRAAAAVSSGVSMKIRTPRPTFVQSTTVHVFEREGLADPAAGGLPEGAATIFEGTEPGCTITVGRSSN